MNTQKSRRPSAALIVASLSLFVSMSGATYAATGGNFQLGKSNSANKATTLSSTTKKGATLNVKNTGGKPAAAFSTGSGKAPFTVTSDTKVGKLNADLLDGLSAESFVRADEAVPAASLYNSHSEATASAAGFVVDADGEIFDHGNLHSTETNTTALVVPKTGMYAVNATVDWDPNATGYRRSSIVGPNGHIASVAGPALPPPAYTSQQISGVEYLQAGQQVQVEVLQGSGGALNVRLARFAISYLGK